MSGHFSGLDVTSYPSAEVGDSEEPFVYTSIRYDRRLVECAQNTAASCNKSCPIYLLEHHWTRLQVARWSTFFFADDRLRPNSGGPITLYRVLLDAVRQWHEAHPGEHPEALRIKFRSYVGGRMQTEIYHPIQSVPMSSLFPPTFDAPIDEHKPAWMVVLDTEPTEPGESTMFKTNDRGAYGRARGRAEILTYMVPKEVLLYTDDRNILDGSICTPYFKRQGAWITPSSGAGGLQGTTRRWALENKLCSEGSVSIDSLADGEIVWLSNAVRGYFCAAFQSRQSLKTKSDQEPNSFND